MVQVKLLKPHTHAGVDFVPGTVLDVDERRAQWLVDLGVGARHEFLVPDAGKPEAQAMHARPRGKQRKKA